MKNTDVSLVHGDSSSNNILLSIFQRLYLKNMIGLLVEIFIHVAHFTISLKYL